MLLNTKRVRLHERGEVHALDLPGISHATRCGVALLQARAILHTKDEVTCQGCLRLAPK